MVWYLVLYNLVSSIRNQKSRQDMETPGCVAAYKRLKHPETWTIRQDDRGPQDGSDRTQQKKRAEALPSIILLVYVYSFICMSS